MAGASSNKVFFRQLSRYYTFYTGGFIAFVVLVGILEQLGVPNQVLGYTFLFATILLYAGIGFMSKTAEVSEYYVAGRRVPALFNGMATGADWMSAASFIGMAGTLYASGYDGLAFVMGWTGGYCLVALFLAPYLRKFGQFTIPDFLGERYGGNIPRFIGVVAAIICSFTYVIAQIYGVGLITSRFTGLEFGIGVFVGLAGILVCSFLGGMKAVTWTQVAQYIILIVAYMIPVVWLSVKDTGNPLAQISAYTTALPKVTALEKEFNDATTPKGAAEESVRAIFRERAAAADAKLKGLEAGGAAFLAEEKKKLEEKAIALRTAATHDAKAIEAAEKAIKTFPATVAIAKAAWIKEKSVGARAEPVVAHAEPFAARSDEERASKKRNFLALVCCLMIGTAALPHILMRYYTTPSVKEARESVFWSLLFIFMLYVTAPALGILVKYEVYHDLVGSSFAQLPAWFVLRAAELPRLDPLPLAASLLAAELDARGPGADTIVHGLMDAVFGYAMRALQQRAAAGQPGWAAAQGDRAVYAALAALHADCAHPWTLDTLAARAGVSRTGLAQRFRHAMGDTPLSYLRTLRMQHAMRLLEDSDRSLEQLAREVGYTDAFSFSKVFKREVGMSPSDYRRRDRQESDSPWRIRSA